VESGAGSGIKRKGELVLSVGRWWMLISFSDLIREKTSGRDPWRCILGACINGRG
jgi:hypothetical protein